ncbi:Protein of unknown function [Bacillus mycoides]
MNRTY